MYAQRINGGYNKEDLWSVDPDTHLVEEEPHTLANRTVARKVLAETPGLITVADRVKGTEVRKYISSKLMLKALTKKLSSFEESLSHAVALEEFIVPQDKMYIGIVNSQITAYEKMKKRRQTVTGFCIRNLWKSWQ